MGKTEKYTVGTKWERSHHKYDSSYPRIIEAVHYNGNDDDGEDVIVYRSENGNLGYDRRYSMDASNWTKFEVKWVKDQRYVSGGESPIWTCVHVYSNGVGVLVHEQYGRDDVMLRVAPADREFYQETR